MGRLVLFAALLGAALLGCTSREETPPVGGEMVLNTPVVSFTERELEAIASSTVKVWELNDKGEILSRGSGVVLAHEGGTSVILTARHIANGEPLRAWAVSQGRVHVPAEFIHASTAEGLAGDFALLRVNSLVGTPAARYPDVGIRRFAPCVAAGYALGLNSITVTEGRLQDAEGGVVRYSAPSIFGNSGGGLWAADTRGQPRLLGLVVALFVDRGAPITHMCLAVDLRPLQIP